MCLSAGIIIEGKEKYIDKDFKIVNIYAPYNDRKELRDNVNDNHLFLGNNVIIGGDLNLTLNSKKSWVEIARLIQLLT